MTALPRILSAALAFAAAAASAATPELQTFTTQARVEVDASGAIVAVTPDDRLPVVLRDAVMREVGSWRFEPPSRAGAPVSGTTYVQLHGCATDDPAGGLRLALVYSSHGPGMRNGALFPPLPVQVARRGEPVAVRIRYLVQPDGRGVFEQVVVTEGAASAARHFPGTLRGWLREARFLPEQIDGIPVATRVERSLSFSFTDDASADAERKASQASTSCRVLQEAQASRNAAGAIDSPFRFVRPVPDASSGQP